MTNPNQPAPHEKFRCNDCERGFTNETAWRRHGAQTGHNFNGDLPGRETLELRDRVAKLETAYKMVNDERARLATKLDAIICVVKL